MRNFLRRNIRRIHAAYAEICVVCANMCKFFYMQRSFRICDFENTIIFGKMCNMRVLAKYAIAYSHITSIPNWSWIAISSKCSLAYCIAVNILSCMTGGEALPEDRPVCWAHMLFDQHLRYNNFDTELDLLFLLLARYIPNVAKRSIWDQCNIEDRPTTDFCSRKSFPEATSNGHISPTVPDRHMVTMDHP